MLDLRFIRENKDAVYNGAKAKNIEIDVDKILDFDLSFRELSTEVQNLRAERNLAAQNRDIEKGREIKQKLDGLEAELKKIEEELNNLVLEIPNIPKSDVKVGQNESENEIFSKKGNIREFNFKPLDHVELGELLDIIDIERAVKVSGARFYYLKNEGALLEMALVRFAMEKLLQRGFKPIVPPTIISKAVMKKLGYMEHGGEEDMFHLSDNDKVMVGTAEQSIVPMHMNETFDLKDLPVRYVGYSSSFRREAGSYGKDTRGILE